MTLKTGQSMGPTANLPTTSSTAAEKPARQPGSASARTASGALSGLSSAPATAQASSAAPRGMGTLPRIGQEPNITHEQQAAYGRLPTEPGSFEVTPEMVHTPGTQKPPRENSGIPYQTAQMKLPDGSSAKVYGFTTPRGDFIVSNPTNHKAVARMKAEGSGESMMAIPVKDSGLKGGARGDYRDENGVLRDKKGRRIVYEERGGSSSSRSSPRSTHSSLDGDTRSGLRQYPPHSSASSSAAAAYTSQGYQHVGYHGTSQTAALNILDRGLDPRQMGSNSGLDKGSGFYMSSTTNVPEDFAYAATHSTETRQTRWGEEDVSVPRPGTDGQPAMLAVYQRPSSNTRANSTFGVMASQGDPNYDRPPRASDTSYSGSRDNFTQLERVVPARDYSTMRVVPQQYGSALPPVPSRNWAPHREGETPYIYTAEPRSSSSAYGRPYYSDEEEDYGRR